MGVAGFMGCLFVGIVDLFLGLLLFFFFNDTATTEIYTLPTRRSSDLRRRPAFTSTRSCTRWRCASRRTARSEEHTFELQSLRQLVCRLLLEKKKKNAELVHWQHLHIEQPPTEDSDSQPGAFEG